MAPDGQILREMILQGRAKDLRAILYGVSRYNTHPASVQEPDRSRSMLWELAVRYVDLMASNFGPHLPAMAIDSPALADAHQVFHEAFEEWIRTGAPFLVWDDLADYLREYPLDIGSPGE